MGFGRKRIYGNDAPPPPCICHTEPQDGMTHKAVLDFASLGAGGEHPQNIERDLHAWSRALLGFQLDPYYLKLDLLKGNDEATGK